MKRRDLREEKKPVDRKVTHDLHDNSPPPTLHLPQRHRVILLVYLDHLEDKQVCLGEDFRIPRSNKLMKIRSVEISQIICLD